MQYLFLLHKKTVSTILQSISARVLTGINSKKLRYAFGKKGFAALQDLFVYSAEVTGIPWIVDILGMRSEVHEKMNLPLRISAKDKSC